MSIELFNHWRRGSCTLRDSKAGEAYVVLEEDAAQEYDPFDVGEDLLIALLTLGWKPDEQMEYRILDFCRRFGLLGFGQSLIAKEYDSSIVKLQKDNIWNTNAVTEEEFMDRIFPFDKHSHRVAKGREAKMTSRWGGGSAWKIFQAGYAEQVAWIVSYAVRLYELYQSFQKGGSFSYPLGNVRIIPQVEKGTAHCLWEYDSLKSAVDILFLELLQTSSSAIRLCGRCGRPFLAPQGTRTAYCSVSCRNVANVTRSRKRKRSST